MEDADEKSQKKEAKEAKNGEKSDEKTTNTGILVWIIIAVVVIVCAAGGFGLGQLLAGSGTSEKTEPSQQTNSTLTEKPKHNDHSKAASGKSWFFTLDPVVANLNVPRAERYVRATLTLEMSSELDQKEGTKLLEQKKPILTNWLAVYLANLTLEDVTGAKNLRRIQSQVLDAFNEQLFPDAKPQVKKILLKEFPIQ